MTSGKMVFFPAKSDPWVVGRGHEAAVSPQLSILSVAGRSPVQFTAARTTPQLFSHEKICIKSLKENSDVFYTFCAFKMFVDIAKFLSKKLEPIYTSTSSV